MTPSIRLATGDDLARLPGLRLPDLEAAVAAGAVLLALAADGADPGGAALDGDAVALWLAPGLPTRRRSSSASIHVRSLDTEVVERTARQFVPRLGRSGGTAVLPPRDGWIAVYDELCDRDRKAHRCLAEELSVGRLVDECLSVPDHYRPLPTSCRRPASGRGARCAARPPRRGPGLRGHRRCGRRPRHRPRCRCLARVASAPYE